MSSYPASPPGNDGSPGQHFPSEESQQKLAQDGVPAAQDGAGLDFKASRILIVDDERVNLLLLKSLLTKGGYSCIVSITDSREVAASCAEEAPAIVLLDLMMPHRDGFGILEDLKTLREEQFLPVLVLTADGNPGTHKRVMAAGANGLLTKPLIGAEVLRHVQQLLETAHLQRQERDGRTAPEHRDGKV